MRAIREDPDHRQRRSDRGLQAHPAEPASSALSHKVAGKRDPYAGDSGQDP
jgi:hypothetical protein